MKLLLLAVLFIAACGSVGQGAAPSPSASQNPMHFDVTATERDHAVSMHVGQELQVALHGGTQLNYEQVKSNDESVLAPTVNPAATAARGVTLAAFIAKSAGTTRVTAVGAPVCPSGTMCPMYAVLYTLTVTVAP